ncbi:AAA family ATPase [Tundrisphaera lichenicola]|uniref:AAA family ATPase n=1 Tax=Tundrisphaera lichenicola TaxID=2029860 RepID=UPI003EBF73B6
MAKLIIIVGVGGSGKTTYGKSLAEERYATAFIDGTLAEGDARRAGFRCLGEMVARLLGRGEDCVMDESHLTHPGFRETFKDFCDQFLAGVDQEWIFFENDILACINNVYFDQNKAKPRIGLPRLKAVQDQGRHYEVPPPGIYPGHHQARSVYQQPSPQFNDILKAQTWLQAEIERQSK